MGGQTAAERYDNEAWSGNRAVFEEFLRRLAEFGRVVKEGLLEDGDNREAILDLISVASTHDPEQLTTLPPLLPEPLHWVTDVVTSGCSVTTFGPHTVEAGAPMHS